MAATASLLQLSLLFALWKILSLAVAFVSPGVGYDTSTRILFDQYRTTPASWTERQIEQTVLKLTRWDGIYFAALSERGHVNEQDWAFSWLLTRAVDWTANSSLSSSRIVDRALLCILASHLSHFLAVLVLHRLTLELVPRSYQSRERIAFTAAVLHIVSPAGIFLSAPSGESPFAWFNFLGTLSHVYAVKLRTANESSLAKEATFTVTAGLFFAIAAMMRGNGLLSGILFALDALQDLIHPRELLTSTTRLGRLAATGLAGALVGIGYATPQIVAYLEYCTAGNTRPWCDRIPPSIFSWVQSHYWGVGLFRYWTLSNAPLFLLATPMVGILFATGIAAFHTFNYIGNKTEQKLVAHSFQRLAIPQLVLALLTVTTFHVQIINRISSGYPLWYIVLAIRIDVGSGTKDASGRENSKRQEESKYSQRLRAVSKTKRTSYTQWVVRGMIMYAIVQGGLYACFLPPA